MPRLGTEVQQSRLHAGDLLLDGRSVDVVPPSTADDRLQSVLAVVTALVTPRRTTLETAAHA